MNLGSVTGSLQWAGWLIVSQVVLLAAAVIHFEFGSPELAAVAFALYGMAHLLACLLLGIAAGRLGRSWSLYALLPLLAPLLGPLCSLAWLSILHRAGDGPGPAPLRSNQIT